MIIINEKEYKLKFSLLKLEQLERQLGEGIISILKKSNSMPSIAQLRIIFMNCLWNEEKQCYCSTSFASEVFETALTDEGYGEIVNEVVQALLDDCPFLFRTNS